MNVKNPSNKSWLHDLRLLRGKQIEQVGIADKKRSMRHHIVRFAMMWLEDHLICSMALLGDDVEGMFEVKAG